MLNGTVWYSWFHIKGTWSVHAFNGDYLSIPEGTGSCEYLFHNIPSTSKDAHEKDDFKNMQHWSTELLEVELVMAETPKLIKRDRVGGAQGLYCIASLHVCR